MDAQELIDTAKALVADDKGLLAMDESNPTCNKTICQIRHPADGGGWARLSGIHCDDAWSWRVYRWRDPVR